MIHQKISLLNRTTLESLEQTDRLVIIERFTKAGLEILKADFGFAWWKDGEKYSLVYKSPTTPYAPNYPRDKGGNNIVQTTKQPLFVEDVSKEIEVIKNHVGPYMESYVIIPIFFKENSYGNMVFCFKEKHIFDQEERSLCVALGNSAAQAVTINGLLINEKQARLEAEKQEARFRALIENSNDAIILIDAEGKILDASPSVTKMSGYLPQDLLEKSMMEFIHPEYSERMSEHMQNTLRNPDKAYTVEFRYRHNDGSWRWMESTGVNMLSHPGVDSIVVNIRDVTERKNSEETIRHQAFHDALTGLPNREEMAVRMDQALESAKRHSRMLAVMFVDMDRFKNYNDNLGHGVGDTVLKVAATRIQASLRAEDTVSRFGGDEFVILLNEIGANKDAVLVADKILKAMSLPVQIGEHILRPSVSIGIAVYPHDGMDRETLKKHADIALYRAKAQGRNRYQLFDNSMESYESERFNLENALRKALEEEQIILYYQPIVSLKKKSVVALEALARWQHPTRGLLLPNEFIPLAEETGYISALGGYILRQVLKQYRIWQAVNLAQFRMAVNLSAQQFSEPDFVPKLQELLHAYDLDPEILDFEITESLAMANLEWTGTNLKQLKKMGVHISIDDFGTGYSSLSYLKRFPINNLKIDRSFVRHSITSGQDASIVRTIISIAQNLNLKVIAEGVETDQQLAFLEGLGCDAVQGFFIAPPMPAEALPQWFLDHNTAGNPQTGDLISPLKSLGKKIFSRS